MSIGMAVPIATAPHTYRRYLGADAPRPRRRPGPVLIEGSRSTPTGYHRGVRIAFLVLVSCGHSAVPLANAATVPADDPVIIRLERSECMGWCPARAPYRQ